MLGCSGWDGFLVVLTSGREVQDLKKKKTLPRRAGELEDVILICPSIRTAIRRQRAAWVLSVVSLQ